MHHVGQGVYLMHLIAVIEQLLLRNFFHSDIEVRRPNAEAAYYGIFANKDIPAKEVLMTIPKSCLISAGGVQVGDYSWFQDVDKVWYSAFVTAVQLEKRTVDVVYENGEKEYGLDMEAATKGGDISMECGTIRNLIKELKLGDNSAYAPYVNYLLDQGNATIPSFWSDKGKAFLLHVQGSLPPLDMIGWSWTQICGGRKDPLEEKAAMAQVSRGWDDFLVPLFDMMNHRGGKWTNTENSHMKWNTDIQVRAARDIKAGDQLYNNYLLDTNSNDLYSGYGTPEMLRDYGFIEQFPQRWSFIHPAVNFELDLTSPTNTNANTNANPNDLHVKWQTLDAQPPPKDKIIMLSKELTRLLKLDKTYFTTPQSSIPRNEWDIIHQYLQAVVLALTHAINAATVGNCNNEQGNKLIDCKYDTLQFKPDPLDYIDMTCEFGRNMHFPKHKNLENVQTPYQHIEIYGNPEDKDTCFSLDGIVQICGSYRPHYHEMAVHSAARFLQLVKRVVFVGGGDSMLLHEILKYASLELVIGLEIDQTVTRKSFKHFGTQPHWDNDKVQWYYGDAAKSLLMLPKEYFGTFDLILVDLSETVMSITVTDGLDIMAALGLLLKPEGILVKNEIYLEKLSEVFQHTLQLHFYDVPVVCSQALIFGSNSINFFTTTNKDHQVDTLWPKHFPKLDDREDMDYSAWHDYRYNSGYKKMCKEDNKIDHDTKEQDKSPGIVMILETEKGNADLNSISDLVQVITNALDYKGLGILSSRINSSSDGDNNAMAVLIMREGYIVARTWPEHNYCAFDIHLWSSFEKMNDIRKTLISIMGSGEETFQTSSYRIVAGGMFGVSKWRDDVKKRGPWFTQSCKESSSPIIDSETDAYMDFMSDDILLDTVIGEGISLIADDHLKVLVVCGYAGDPCRTLDKLQNHNFVDEVVEMWSCKDMEHGAENMAACEEKTIEFLRNSTTTDELPTMLELQETDRLVIGDRVITTFPGVDRRIAATVRAINPNGTFYVTFDNGFVVFNLDKHYVYRYVKNNSLFYQKKFRAIFIDPSVPYTMGRVLYNIFKKEKTFLKHDFSVISLMVEGDTSTWRRNLLDRFRTDIVEHDPLFCAEILFKHVSGSTLKMGVTSSGDPLFISNIKHAISNIDKYSLGGITSDLQFIQGGQFNFQPDFQPISFFLPKDYDQTSPLDQWKSQLSLGRQTIFQLEKKMTEEVSKALVDGDTLAVGDDIEGNFFNEGEWYDGTVTKVHPDNTYDILYEDGDVEHQVAISQLVKLVEIPIKDEPLTTSMIKGALEKALSSFTQVCQNVNNCSDGEEEISEFTSLGDGDVLVALWPRGSVVILWDGRIHIDVNIFTFAETEDAHGMFVDHFVEVIPSLQMALHDTQPRGTGRVVNFKDDRVDELPHWA